MGREVCCLFTGTWHRGYVNKKLTNVGSPTASADAATKKYVDDNSSWSPTTSRLRVDSNIEMNDSYRILNLPTPSDADEPATKQQADINFFYRDASHPMTGNVNMNNNKLEKLLEPSAGGGPVTKTYGDTNYIKTDETSIPTASLNMSSHRIEYLADPQGLGDAATKKYTDNLVKTTVADYVKLDGTAAMTGDFNIAGHKIINLRTPKKKQ